MRRNGSFWQGVFSWGLRFLGDVLVKGNAGFFRRKECFFSRSGVCLCRGPGAGAAHMSVTCWPPLPHPQASSCLWPRTFQQFWTSLLPCHPSLFLFFSPFQLSVGTMGLPSVALGAFRGWDLPSPGGFGTGRGAQIPWIGVPSVSCVPQFLWWCEDPIDLLVFHPVAVLYSHPLPALGALTAPLPVFPVYPRPFGPVGINEETPEPAQITGPEPGRRPGGGPPTMGGSPKTRQGQTLWILRQRRSCI